MNVKQYAQWVYTMIKTAPAKRKEWIKIIFDNLKSKKTKEFENLVEMLQDRSNFDLIGFAPNLHYIKHDKRRGDTEEDLGCVFVHAWATPKLLFTHKRLPVIIIVGDDMRYDDSVLNEQEKNPTVPVRGFTG